MPTFLIHNNYSQSTAQSTTPIVVADQVEARAVFSINALNQLQGSLWVIKNGQLMVNDLGEAQYEVFDKNGISVGIIETGITADANGQYQTTPVSALLIQDLTHYLVKIEISYNSQLRTNYIGITLGE